jgi:hypothetical protein
MKPISFIIIAVIAIGVGAIVYLATRGNPSAGAVIRDIDKGVERGVRDSTNGIKDAAQDAKDKIKDAAR